jgi:hypothetical protein
MGTPTRSGPPSILDSEEGVLSIELKGRRKSLWHRFKAAIVRSFAGKRSTSNETLRETVEAYAQEAISAGHHLLKRPALKNLELMAEVTKRFAEAEAISAGASKTSAEAALLLAQARKAESEASLVELDVSLKALKLKELEGHFRYQQLEETVVKGHAAFVKDEHGNDVVVALRPPQSLVRLSLEDSSEDD